MKESLTKQIKNLNTLIENNRQQVEGSFSSLKSSITPLKIVATVVGGACLGYFLFTRRAKLINPLINPLKKGSKAVTGFVTKYPANNFFRFGLLNTLMLLSGFSRYFHLIRGISSLLGNQPRRVSKAISPYSVINNRDGRDGVTLH